MENGKTEGWATEKEVDAHAAVTHEECEQLSQRAVVLSHRTALQIASILELEQYARNRHAQSLPDEAPTRHDVEDAIRLLTKDGRRVEVSQPAHYLVGGTTRRHRNQRFFPHSFRAQLPPASLRRLGSRVYCSSPALAYLQILASDWNFIGALVLGWEMCGTYRTGRTSFQARNETMYDRPPLADAKELRSILKYADGITGRKRLESLLPYLAEGSASPRETMLGLLMGLPLRYGGYALGIPRMNYEVPTSREAERIAGRSSLRCDLCWPEKRLDVEYQSDENHDSADSRVSDSRRTNALELMGWRVVEITKDELDDPGTTDGIAKRARIHLGIRKTAASPEVRRRRLELRGELGLPN